MKKVNELMTKPITIGGYLKFAGVLSLIGIGLSAASWLWFTKPWKKSYGSVDLNEDDEYDGLFDDDFDDL